MKIGVPGSIAHVLTNDKVKDKKDCLKDMSKEGVKDTLVIGGVTAGAAGVAAGATKLATKYLPETAAKVGEFIQAGKSKIGETLSHFSFKSENLKEIVKNSKIYTKFNALPAPAKAAIGVGAAALAVIGTLVGSASISKAGYIEGQHESK